MSNRGVKILAAVAAPLLLLYMLLAYVLAVVLTLLVFPRIILARKIYWCVSSLRVVSIFDCNTTSLLGSYWLVANKQRKVDTLCVQVLPIYSPHFHSTGVVQRQLSQAWL